MKPNLLTSRGRVTAYGFACGYMESRWFHHTVVRLWKEHGVYFVRCFNHGIGSELSTETFLVLSHARQVFSSRARKCRTENTVCSASIKGV